MAEIEYTFTDEKELDLIADLWRKLNTHHRERSEHFKTHFDRMNFEQRKGDLLENAFGGSLRIDLAKDTGTGELVGYCVSTVNKKSQGEIESIFIEEDYRRRGIGDVLVRNALAWMNGLSANRITIGVAAGNEEAFAFYRNYGFYPRMTSLLQVREE